MTSVSVSQSYKTIVVSEDDGQTVTISAPGPSVIVETVGVGPQGPGGVLALYASIIDTTDQPIVTPSVAQAIRYNTLLSARGISIQDSSKIYFQLSGTYKILFSLQLTNSSNQLTEADFFLKKNGTNIDNSNTRIDLQQRKSISVPHYNCITVEIQLDIVGGDYIQIFWVSENANVAIDTIPADASHPQAPSVILNIAQVMFGQLSATTTTVALLPSAVTVGAGVRSFVTDATSTTFLSIVSGGGSNKVPVVSNGINWVIG